MDLISFFNKFYRFNIYNRDKWIKQKSKVIKRGLKVLDVGAGSAPYRNLFNHCEYITQDFAQLNADQIRGKKGYTLIDIISDISSIPIDDESIDVVICTEVLEHLPHPIKAIEEMSRMLKSGGTLIITAPLNSGIHQEPFHFYGGFTPFFYTKFLTENNFTINELSSNKGFYSFFSQELLRFSLRTAPWKSLLNILFIPVWLFLFPIVLILPLFSSMLDRHDCLKDFTIGYHILATKS